MICVLYLDLLGVLKWAGADINPVSYVSLVLSIGLMVDYLMYVLLCYYGSEGKREEKTIESLRTMGSSVLWVVSQPFLALSPWLSAQVRSSIQFSMLSLASFFWICRMV